MHLGSDFADPKFARNLLVHETRRDQAKYFLFTLGQCFETSARLENRTFSDTTVTIALESELNRGGHRGHGGQAGHGTKGLAHCVCSGACAALVILERAQLIHCAAAWFAAVGLAGASHGAVRTEQVRSSLTPTGPSAGALENIATSAVPSTAMRRSRHK
jgi:hypothetical protein